MIVFALGITCGNPTAMAVSVRAADSGIGKTGCGVVPKTRPENHLLVGGSRPAASRVGATLATFFCVTAARSDRSCPSGIRDAEAGTDAEGEDAAVGDDAAPAVGEPFDEQAVRSATPASSAIEPRRLLTTCLVAAGPIT